MAERPWRSISSGKDIAARTWTDAWGRKKPLLSEDEVYNLCIPRGTLTPEERQIINGHMDVTLDMLGSLPFPRKLQRVPEYAGGHHEKWMALASRWA